MNNKSMMLIFTEAKMATQLADEIISTVGTLDVDEETKKMIHKNATFFKKSTNKVMREVKRIIKLPHLSANDITALEEYMFTLRQERLKILNNFKKVKEIAL